MGLMTMVTNDKETEAAEDDPSNQSPPLWTIFKQVMGVLLLLLL